MSDFQRFVAVGTLPEDPWYAEDQKSFSFMLRMTESYVLRGETKTSAFTIKAKGFSFLAKKALELALIAGDRVGVCGQLRTDKMKDGKFWTVVMLDSFERMERSTPALRHSEHAAADGPNFFPDKDVPF